MIRAISEWRWKMQLMENRLKITVFTTLALFILVVTSPLALSHFEYKSDFMRHMDKLKAEDLELLHPRETKRPVRVFRGTPLVRTHWGMV
jgi:hypothetical protein